MTIYEFDQEQHNQTLREEGYAEGREEGRAEGREEGYAEGREAERLRTIKTELGNGMTKEDVKKFLNVTEEELEKLVEAHNDL